MIAQYILLGLLLVCAVVIIVAVTLAKTSEDGLSGTIAGGNDTYYGKDKSAQTGKKLYRWTLIACVIFAVAVIAVYVIQPDYSAHAMDGWKSITDFASIFN